MQDAKSKWSFRVIIARESMPRRAPYRGVARRGALRRRDGGVERARAEVRDRKHRVEFERGVFANTAIEIVREAIAVDGWDPVVIDDASGTVYPEHAHAADKLLVFVSGSMEVEAGGQRFDCQPGDRLVIAGSTPHAAWVGQDGCTFFWSEQVRERR
jgi:mannose-6-phosphate isomerase-like protein (cupin superfamily)